MVETGVLRAKMKEMGKCECVAMFGTGIGSDGVNMEKIGSRLFMSSLSDVECETAKWRGSECIGHEYK